MGVSGTQETEADEKASQTVSAKSNAAAELTFDGSALTANVPGSDGDLLRAKSEGGDVRPVYSPLDALALAQAHPDREVVFFAAGFETTTAPVAGMRRRRADTR